MESWPKIYFSSNDKATVLLISKVFHSTFHNRCKMRILVTDEYEMCRGNMVGLHITWINDLTVWLMMLCVAKFISKIKVIFLVEEAQNRDKFNVSPINFLFYIGDICCSYKNLWLWYTCLVHVKNTQTLVSCSVTV